MTLQKSEKHSQNLSVQSMLGEEKKIKRSFHPFSSAFRYDSNASASSSSEEGEGSEDEGAKKKKAKKVKVVKERKERKPRKEVRWYKGGVLGVFCFFLNQTTYTWLAFPLFYLNRRSRKTLAAPRGQWVPTCCGWTPIVNASGQRILESPSQGFPRGLEKCGGNWEKMTRRWDFRNENVFIILLYVCCRYRCRAICRSLEVFFLTLYYLCRCGKQRQERLRSSTTWRRRSTRRVEVEPRPVPRSENQNILFNLFISRRLCLNAKSVRSFVSPPVSSGTIRNLQWKRRQRGSRPVETRIETEAEATTASRAKSSSRPVRVLQTPTARASPRRRRRRRWILRFYSLTSCCRIQTNVVYTESIHCLFVFFN